MALPGTIIGTYRGVSILQFPSRPSPRQIQLDMVDLVASPRSPFTGAVVQPQVWPGGDWWEATVTLPKMTYQDALVWRAFLAQCRGSLNVFYLYDTSYRGLSEMTSVENQPVADTTNLAMSNFLNTRGWSPNSWSTLNAGDQFQLGHRLHRVVGPAGSDADGKAQIPIWPSLREVPPDGQALILADLSADFPTRVRGLFRLADNRRSTLMDETLLTGITFKAIEAK